ncbi:MAG TPA: helix-turn-helix domain-containing protein [Candidatus Limnocylindrales bacterium]
MQPEQPAEPPAEPPAAAALAVRIRQLRQEHGLSQRKVAKALHLASHSSVADLESGRRTPSAELTAAYETLFGLPEGELETARRQHLRERVDPAPPPPSPPPAPRIPSRFLWGTGGFALGSIVTAVTMLALTATTPTPPSTSTPTPTPTPMVWFGAATVHPFPTASAQQRVDGADPARTLCTKTATVDLARADVFLEHRLLGALVLRYSGECDAAWARFEPNGSLINDPARSILIRLEAVRVADSTAARDEDEFVRDNHYSGMVLVRNDCAMARGAVVIDARQSEVAETPCLRPNS